MRRPAAERTRIDWFSRVALRLHATLVIGVAGCAAAAWFEWTRALSGHEVAWAYSFEWPLFGVVGTYIWWKLVHQEAADRSPSSRAVADPIAEQQLAIDDPELAAWQAYLARLQAADPPGGPPVRDHS